MHSVAISLLRISRSSAMPSTFGILRSASTTPNGSAIRRSSARCPSPAISAVVAFVAKNGAQPFGDGAFVVGDQDLCCHVCESTPARASAGNRRCVSSSSEPSRMSCSAASRSILAAIGLPAPPTSRSESAPSESPSLPVISRLAPTVTSSASASECTHGIPVRLSQTFVPPRTPHRAIRPPPSRSRDRAPRAAGAQSSNLRGWVGGVPTPGALRRAESSVRARWLRPPRTAPAPTASTSGPRASRPNDLEIQRKTVQRVLQLVGCPASQSAEGAEPE